MSYPKEYVNEDIVARAACAGCGSSNEKILLLTLAHLANARGEVSVTLGKLLDQAAMPGPRVIALLTELTVRGYVTLRPSRGPAMRFRLHPPPDPSKAFSA